MTTQRKTAKASKLCISVQTISTVEKKLFLLLLIILKLSVKGEVIYKASCNVSILDT